jgi:hypothetical protein
VNVEVNTAVQRAVFQEPAGKLDGPVGVRTFRRHPARRLRLEQKRRRGNGRPQSAEASA